MKKKTNALACMVKKAFHLSGAVILIFFVSWVIYGAWLNIFMSPNPWTVYSLPLGIQLTVMVGAMGIASILGYACFGIYKIYEWADKNC